MKSSKEECISEDIWPLIDETQPGQHEFSDHLEDKQIKQYLDNYHLHNVKSYGVYFQDMSQEQLAEHLNIPVGTVKSRLRLAFEVTQ